LGDLIQNVVFFLTVRIAFKPIGYRYKPVHLNDAKIEFVEETGHKSWKMKKR